MTCWRIRLHEGNAHRESRSESVEQVLDSLSEGIPGAMKPALDGSQVHSGDLRDLLVALSFKLPEPKDQPMVLRQLFDRVLDEPLKESLPIQVVGPHAKVLELQRTMVIIPAIRKLLKKHKRASGTVPKLILRQIARNRIHPRRELLAGIEAM